MAEPGFQADGAFQLATNFGFQTQIPVPVEPGWGPVPPEFGIWVPATPEAGVWDPTPVEVGAWAPVTPESGVWVPKSPPTLGSWSP